MTYDHTFTFYFMLIIDSKRHCLFVFTWFSIKTFFNIICLHLCVNRHQNLPIKTLNIQSSAIRFVHFAIIWNETNNKKVLYWHSFTLYIFNVSSELTLSLNSNIFVLMSVSVSKQRCFTEPNLLISKSPIVDLLTPKGRRLKSINELTVQLDSFKRHYSILTGVTL